MDAVAALAGTLAPVTLAELEQHAGLLTRTDRKYVVTPDRLGEVLDRIAPSMHVLDVDDRRHFAYESVYFDTPLLASYLGAARGWRHRFKVRTRTYLDTGRCLLEVKVKNGRDQTVKHRIEHPGGRADHLDDDGRAFVAEYVTLPSIVHDLGAVLTTAYVRTTLVGNGLRATIDADLRCTRSDRAAVALPGVLVVETKSHGPASPVDRALWSAGLRPLPCSKFALGMALLDPSLPRNKWHPVLSRLTPHVRLTPRSTP